MWAGYSCRHLRTLVGVDPTGAPRDNGGYQACFLPIIERSGRRRIRFRDLGHTFRSLLIQGGASLEQYEALSSAKSGKLLKLLQNPQHNSNNPSSAIKLCLHAQELDPHFAALSKDHPACAAFGSA